MNFNCGFGWHGCNYDIHNVRFNVCHYICQISANDTGNNGKRGEETETVKKRKSLQISDLA